MALAGCSEWQRIITQIRDIAHRAGKQKLAAENARNADSPDYFAFRDRN
jgi:hypothetical protein